MKIEKRTRQLANGKWVCEVRRKRLVFQDPWKAVDVKSPGNAWECGSRYFKDCFAETKEEAEKNCAEYVSICFGL